MYIQGRVRRGAGPNTASGQEEGQHMRAAERQTDGIFCWE